MSMIAIEPELREALTSKPRPAPASASPLAPTVLESLRRTTRSGHGKLAACPQMARLFDPTYSVPEYRAHLACLVGLFEPLERAVAEAATLLNDPADPVHFLHGADALREDLLALGLSAAEIDSLPRCRHLPSITLAGLPGYTYVILGSRLGGKIIVERLRSVLGASGSYHFYEDVNLRAEAMWASFCARLENGGPKNVAAICDTAMDIFDAYAAWLRAASEDGR